MDPFILLISVRPLTINIGTSINFLPDLHLRLKVGLAVFREKFFSCCFKEYVCLCLNILEHSALAVYVLLSTHLTAALVPLSEHKSNG